MELIYTTGLVVGLGRKFWSYWKGENGVKKESAQTVMNNALDVVTFGLMVPAMYSLGFGGFMKLAMKLQTFVTVTLRVLRGMASTFGGFFSNEKNIDRAFDCAEKSVVAGFQRAGAAVTEKFKAENKGSEDAKHYTPLLTVANPVSVGVAQAKFTCGRCGAKHDGVHECVVPDAKAAESAHNHMPGTNCDKSCPAFVDLDAEKPASVPKTEESVWKRLKKMFSARVTGLESKSVKVTTSSGEIKELQMFYGRVGPVAKVGVCLVLFAVIGVVIYMLRSKKEVKAEKSKKKYDQSGGSKKNRGNKKGIMADMDELPTTSMNCLDCDQPPNLCDCVGGYRIVESSGGVKLRHECAHVQTGPHKCPKGLKCSAGDVCNTACGGHHCSHWAECNPKAPLKKECLHAATCPKKLKNIVGDCDVSCGSDCCHWGSCKRVGGPVGTDPTKDAAQNSANGKVNGTKPGQESGWMTVESKGMKKAKSAKKAKSTKAKAKGKSAEKAEKQEAKSDQKNPSKRGQSFLDGKLKPNKLKKLQSMDCRWGAQCHDLQFNACPMRHLSAKASKAQQAPMKLKLQLKAQSGVIAEWECSKETLDHVRAPVPMTPEALYGKKRFVLPTWVGKVVASSSSPDMKDGGAFVNCTFVQHQNRRVAVFVEHVLFPAKDVKSTHFTVTYHDNTSDKFAVSELQKLTNDLVCVNIPQAKWAQQQFAGIKLPSESPEEVYVVAYDSFSAAIPAVSQGRLFDKYHNAATIAGNCSGPLVDPLTMKVVGFHQGTVEAEKINVCIPVSSGVLASLSN
jgi:hypothetical protein